MPTGAVGDRFGARTALFAAMLLAASSLFRRASASNAVALFASMVLFGLGLALIMSSFPKAIAAAFGPEELGMANGIAQAGVGLGLGSATLLAPWVADSLGGPSASAEIELAEGL